MESTVKLPLTQTLKGNEKQFETAGVQVIGVVVEF